MAYVKTCRRLGNLGTDDGGPIVVSPPNRDKITPPVLSPDVYVQASKSSKSLITSILSSSPAGKQMPKLEPSFWDRLTTWGGQEAFAGTGIKNGYLASGGGFLLLLALAAGSRRRY